MFIKKMARSLSSMQRCDGTKVSKYASAEVRERDEVRTEEYLT